MSLTIVARPSASHQMQHAQALRDGLAVHGVSAKIIHSHESVKSDAVACWGWRRGAMHKAAGRRVLVMERGYLGDRFVWASLGWDGLNGRARFPEQQDSGERFAQHFGHLMQPWSIGGEYVLIVGQVPGDASLGGRCLNAWYAEQAQRANRRYGLPVRFRPHPMAVRRHGVSSIPGAETIGGDLHENIARAALVITFNSNTGVESILAGKPTVALDAGSMATGVALPDLPHWLDIEEPDRLPWAQRLAWCQFTVPEIASGYAWELVRAREHG